MDVSKLKKRKHSNTHERVDADLHLCNYHFAPRNKILGKSKLSHVFVPRK